MSLLRDSRDDYIALIGAASDAFGFPQEFIEKDYWVTEVLRSIAKPFDGARVVFKGGTSLSKAFCLIARMSEDVDILLVLGPKTSTNSRDKILKGLAARVLSDLPLSGELSTSTTGIKRNTIFKYPTLAEIALVSEGVLLEMGIRGGAHPVETMDLRSYIAQHALASGASQADYEELEPVRIDVLGPERTLVEKLAALHHLSTNVGSDSGSKYLALGARHYYDVAKLLADQNVRDRLVAIGDLAAIVDSINEESQKWRLPFSPRPPGGFGDSPAFGNDPTIMSIVEPAYLRAMEFVPAKHDRPSLTDCLGVVARYRDLI